MMILDIILTGLDFVTFAYFDWGAALILGYIPETLTEIVIGQIAHLIFAGSLGILLAFLMSLTTSKNYLFKGWLFGVIVWFSVHVIINLSNFMLLRPIDVSTALSDFFTASIYGLLTAKLLYLLNKAEEQ